MGLLRLQPPVHAVPWDDAGGGGGRRGGAGATGRQGTGTAIADSVAPPDDTLVIEQSPDKLRMKYGDRDSTYHGFDTTRYVQFAGQDAERLSGWQNQDFLIETSNEQGMKITERFALSEDGQQMTHTIEINAERLPSAVSITRVFDRAEDLRPD